MQWTDSAADRDRLLAAFDRISDALRQRKARLRLSLACGQTIESEFMDLTVRSNAGHGGEWRYNGEVHLRMPEGYDTRIDLMSIADVVAPGPGA